MSTFHRYRGDGVAPAGKPYRLRDEEHARYLASDNPELVTAVNTAIAVGQPLLVTGEPGTGKTTLAWSVASELGLLPVLEFHTRSDHRARDVLFVVDHMKRFYDAHNTDDTARTFEKYVTWQALGKAIRENRETVVLIDEIDKAPRDFPNDLLDEIDQMSFTVPEIREEAFTTTQRPIVIITSNKERQLPDPFLRRCVFHRLRFPSAATLRLILQERFPGDAYERLIATATRLFLELRNEELHLDKPPSTGELIAWTRALVRADTDPATLDATPLRDLPYKGALLKNEDDLDRVAQWSR